MKHTKLVTALIFAAMLLILGLLVASVTSCSLEAASTVQLASPTPTVQLVRPAPTVIEDGSFHHPYNVGLNPDHGDSWEVRIPSGRTVPWTLNWIYGPRGVNPYGNTVTLKAGDDILYNNTEYQITAINRKAFTMEVGQFEYDCCASR